MVFVKGGCFMMGDTFGVGDADELPVHEVCLDDFYMDATEVTQEAYLALIGNNPSLINGCDDCPVDNVNWTEAGEYCGALGKRLPTEAEWEYAARSGGREEKFAGTSGDPGEYAWYGKNAGATRPVGKKKPNGLGLYDMTGNVWEWVSDWYLSSYYRKSPRDNPQGPLRSRHKVMRGGSWMNKDEYLIRTSNRTWGRPEEKSSNSRGFRCARDP